jgi:elongation factor P--beta-lysine ligase
LGAVREYVTGLSPEKHAERTRTKGAEKRKRFSENKKLAGPDTLKPEIAEALDDALAALPDLGGMRIGKAKLAAMSPEERVARRKLQKAQSAKRSRSSKKFEADK